MRIEETREREVVLEEDDIIKLEKALKVIQEMYYELDCYSDIVSSDLRYTELQKTIDVLDCLIIEGSAIGREF